MYSTSLQVFQSRMGVRTQGSAANLFFSLQSVWVLRSRPVLGIVCVPFINNLYLYMRVVWAWLFLPQQKC